jgi:hypothetical protein
MATSHVVLSVLFFRDASGIWVAQALERDIAAQGQTQEAAKIAMQRTVAGYLRMDAKLKREPLSSLGPAPQQYWAVWERVSQKTLEPPVISGESTIPPAYVIKAITTESLSANI